ncbi:MAG: GNAT family N-acetyltransferase [Marinomonas sp.]|uniref:GNAT family N-acetyltransferase n=1 Tax=Marinomonas communis TaxID=28254 RepID=UPI000C60BD9A|nr:GNAT family N-acetyltransferase [Marinomonas communis]MAF15965.1 GNAT family N-acetyltransferase [Marinomonas sp.]MCC4273599.1 GNAT family N-acetyltransferase [Marinomonas communis]RUM48738.1 MAG: GNAT family N-acetyltransferase [Marinomonas sp.]RUM55582.1 MAG: GNAT family N-acetyltransferase [Marinomonas sp.]|tara:strand:+ start:762 stop:1223 length:462 start_codon:yes stop_codon:yes gene_type:complete
MDIKIDDLSCGEVIKLLEEHLADMYAVSPPECVHALDVEALRSPDITFFSGWINGVLQGCVAIKQLTPNHIELKSMRTSGAVRQSGIATKLLRHTLNVAAERGYSYASLETGTQDFFLPARRLYEKFGFEYCGPFASYKEDPHSCFMTKCLTK